MSDIRAEVAEVILDCSDLLGEGPAYDATTGRLLWVDILRNQVRWARPASAGRWELERTLELGAPVSAVVPKESGGLLAMVGKDVLTIAETGEASPFATLDEPGPAVRLNDAKCDAEGRLVVGWVDLDGSPGAVVRIGGDGGVETIVTDVGLANGLDWSPDGDTFYLADTLTLRIEAFDYGDGLLAGRRELCAIERGAGAPDGICVDREGCVWVAVPYAGEVRRYAPDGELVEVIETPTRLPTSCAFGGAEGEQLFITSQAGGLVPRDRENDYGITSDRVDAAHDDPHAGALFACRPGVSGPAASPFAA